VASAGILRVRSIERASWRLLGDEVLSPIPKSKGHRTNKSHKMFSLHASAETRRGREEPDKVRCSSAQACDQLDEGL
jgi:hypothetical protein